VPVNPTPQAARDPDGLWKGADALVIDTGALNEEDLYSKSAALQIWLLGIEFTNTVILVCSRSIHVLTDAKKGALLTPLKTAENATLPLEVHVKEKADKNKANYATLIKAIKSSHAGATVASLLKEKRLGEFSALWRAALEATEGLQQVELGPPLALVLSVKDLDEQVCPSAAVHRGLSQLPRTASWRQRPASLRLRVHSPSLRRPPLSVPRSSRQSC
jgi:nucleosome binding factor SPN SPT16 subunit